MNLTVYQLEHSPYCIPITRALGALGVPWQGPFPAHDELTGETYTWDGPTPYVRLDPTQGQVAHILTFRR